MGRDPSAPRMKLQLLRRFSSSRRSFSAFGAAGILVLLVSCARTGRLDHRVLRSDAARRRRPRQLDPDDSGKGLVHDPAPVQSSRAFLHQGVAAERDRAGQVAIVLPVFQENGVEFATPFSLAVK